MRAYQHVLALCTSENDYLVLLWVWCKKNISDVMKFRDNFFDEYPTQVWQNLFFHLKKSWIFSCKQASNFLHERLYSTWTFGSYTHHFVKSSKVKNDQNPIGTTIIHSIEAPWNDNNVGHLVFFCSQINCKNKGNVLKCCHY